jgi:hypothetical protein
MARGISLHVGINQPSSAFPNAATLKGCENDALAMEKIAAAKGFKTRDLLLGSDATYARVTTKIRRAADQLAAGDIFLFTFAGHGFQEVDIGTDQDEDDFLDETLLLFDVELFDDVLRKNLWPYFKTGVRILMIADSCHSGTAFLVPPGDPEDMAANSAIASNPPPISSGMNMDDFPVAPAGHFVPRTISDSTGRQHQAEYVEFYRNLLVPIFDPPINASLLLLAACQDNETTGDGENNGMYTAAMLKVLKEDPADYEALRKGIEDELKNAGRNQNPKLTTAGLNTDAFKAQRPFTLLPP